MQHVKVCLMSFLFVFTASWQAFAQPLQKQQSRWPNGQIRCRLQLASGVLQGSQQLYDSTGQLTAVLNFQKGALHGNQQFYTNGKPERTENWTRGELNTFYKYEVEDGGRVTARLVWKADINLKNGVLTGNRRLSELHTYYGDTQRRSITRFSDSGGYKSWSPAGVLQHRCLGTAWQPAGRCEWYYQELYPGYEGRVWASGIMPVAATWLAPASELTVPGPEDLINWLETYISRYETAEFDPDQRFEDGDWWYYDTAGRLTERWLKDTLTDYTYESYRRVEINRFEDSAWGCHRQTAGNVTARFHSIHTGSDTMVWTWYFPTGGMESTGWMLETRKTGKWSMYDSLQRLVAEIIYDQGIPSACRLLGYHSNSGQLKSQFYLKRYDSLAMPDVQEESAGMRRYSNWEWYHENGVLRRQERYVHNRYDEIPHLQEVREWDSTGRLTGMGTARQMVRYRLDDSGRVVIADSFRFEPDNYWSPREFADTRLISSKTDSGILYARTAWYASGRQKMHLNYGTGVCGKRVLHGLQRGWNNNGSIWFEVTTLCGKPVGTARENYEDGTPAIVWNQCDSFCSEEIYHSRTGKKMRYSGGYTPESIAIYNRTGSKADLVALPRPAAAQAILETSFLYRLIRP